MWNLIASTKSGGVHTKSRRKIEGLDIKECPRTRGLLAGLFMQDGSHAYRRISIADVDIFESDLSGVSLDRCEIVRAGFNGVFCRDWRCFALTAERSSFERVDFRRTVFAPGGQGGFTVFRGVVFTKVDFRRVVFASVQFQDCDFRFCNLKGIDFGGSVFESCRFEGVLDGVVFNRLGPGGTPGIGINEMRDVDLSRATLKSVEFRNLDLTDTKLPSGDCHVLVRSYRARLAAAIDKLDALGSSSDYRALSAYLAVYLRWAGPNQVWGVLHIPEMKRVGGEDAVNQVLPVLSDV
jgi:uncharacterized protein YjbI with pentapeptide repeats